MQCFYTQLKISINSECSYIACFIPFYFLFSIAGVWVCRMCSASFFPIVILRGHPKLGSSGIYCTLLSRHHSCRLHQVWSNSIIHALRDLQQLKNRAMGVGPVICKTLIWKYAGLCKMTFLWLHLDLFSFVFLLLLLQSYWPLTLRLLLEDWKLHSN